MLIVIMLDNSILQFLFIHNLKIHYLKFKWKMVQQWISKDVTLELVGRDMKLDVTMLVLDMEEI